MLTKTNRIILITFFSLLGLGAIFLLYNFLDLRNAVNNGYQETVISKNEYLKYFNENEYDNFELNYSYVTPQNDKLIFLEYDDDYGVVIWKIDQIKKIALNQIEVNAGSIIIQENRKTYTMLTTQVEPYLVFQSKSKIKIENKLFVNIDRKASLLTDIEKHDKYLAFKLNLSQISFNNSKESSDLIISAFEPTETCFLIVPQFNNLTILMLYPKWNKDVNLKMLKELQNIVKP